MKLSPRCRQPEEGPRPLPVPLRAPPLPSPSSAGPAGPCPHIGGSGAVVFSAASLQRRPWPTPPPLGPTECAVAAGIPTPAATGGQPCCPGGRRRPTAALMWLVRPGQRTSAALVLNSTLRPPRPGPGPAKPELLWPSAAAAVPRRSRPRRMLSMRSVARNQRRGAAAATFPAPSRRLSPHVRPAQPDALLRGALHLARLGRALGRERPADRRGCRSRCQTSAPRDPQQMAGALAELGDGAEPWPASEPPGGKTSPARAATELGPGPHLVQGQRSSQSTGAERLAA